jgi:hypothetical protein
VQILHYMETSISTKVVFEGRSHYKHCSCVMRQVCSCLPLSLTVGMPTTTEGMIDRAHYNSIDRCSIGLFGSRQVEVFVINIAVYISSTTMGSVDWLITTNCSSLMA